MMTWDDEDRLVYRVAELVEMVSAVHKERDQFRDVLVQLAALPSVRAHLTPEDRALVEQAERERRPPTPAGAPPSTPRPSGGASPSA